MQKQSQKQSVQTEQQPKTEHIQDAVGYLHKMNSYTLEHKLKISPNGEYLRFGNAKEALDVLKYIEKSLRSRGFGVYALHNCLWIVPFVHREIHLPDFNRAKGVLPDYFKEVSSKFTSDDHSLSDDPWQAEQTATTTPTFNWKKHRKWLIAGVSVIVLLCLFVR